MRLPPPASQPCDNLLQRFDANQTPFSKVQNFTEGRLNCSNEPLNITTPLVAIPANIPDKTVTIQILGSLNATGHENHLMNNQTFRVNFNQPILRLANEGQFGFPLNPEWNVYSTGQSASSGSSGRTKSSTPRSRGPTSSHSRTCCTCTGMTTRCCHQALGRGTEQLSMQIIPPA